MVVDSRVEMLNEGECGDSRSSEHLQKPRFSLFRLLPLYNLHIVGHYLFYIFKESSIWFFPISFHFFFLLYKSMIFLFYYFSLTHDIQGMMFGISIRMFFLFFTYIYSQIISLFFTGYLGEIVNKEFFVPHSE